MRIKTLLRIFSLFILFSLFHRPAEATHLYGGEMTYEYLGQLGTPPNNFRYRITMKHYVSCVGNGITPSVSFNYYNYNGTNAGTFIRSVNQSSFLSPPLALPIPSNCPITFPCIQIRTFTQVVDLPLSFNGYYVTAVANARNSDITNIQGGNMSLYMQIPPPFIIEAGSKSPVFTDTAVVVIFAGDTASVINSAFDSDGDKLIYSFNVPYAFNASSGTFITPPQTVTYSSGYSFAQPFGAGGYASINASTGLAKYYVPPIPGNTTDRKYVVSFQVKEYRSLPGVGDILIGSSIRDIQLVVKDLPPSTNVNPNFTFNGPKIINITEGDAIPPVTFSFSDPNPGQTLKVELGGSLLDGPGGRNATFTAGSNTLTSNTTGITVANNSTATLNFTSVCGQAGTYPLNITLSDNACPPGKKVESFSVVVAPYQGPDKINGDTTVCTNITEAYNVISKATASYTWQIQSGGSFVGSSNNSNVQVQWTAPGRHKLTAYETSTGNCIDSVSFFVNVTPGVNLNIAASATAVCVGTPVTLTASGGTTYTWNDGTNSFTGSTLTVTPNSTTTYSVTGAGITGCNGTNSVTVTVNPLPNVVGVDKTVCDGLSTTLEATGAATYTWTDGTNTYTGNNVSVTPTTTTTYTVTGLNTVTNCTNTDQVTITVTPTPAPAFTGLNTSYCANEPAVTLAANLPGSTFTIDGVNATSLNPASLSVGPHTVIVSNTNSNNCTATQTRIVTIKAVPTANFGTLANAYCKNDPAVSLNIAGSTFQINGTNATTFDPSVLAVGTYNVSVTTTSTPDNCSVTASRSVVINPLPTPSLAFLNSAYCVDAAAVTLPGSSSSTVTYTVNGVNTNTLNPATLGVGTYNVIMNELTAAGCAASTNRTITINPLPTPAFTGLSASYCANDPVVTLASNMTSGTTTFTIDGVAATTLNPATLSVGPHVIGVSNTDPNSCIGTANQTVIIKAVPAANFGTLANAYCKNDPAFPLNNITGSTFQIDGVNATSLDPATLSVGNHTVSVTTTSTPDNCSITATRTVVINAIPTPSLAFLNNAYCQNSPAITLPTGTGISYVINGGSAIPGGSINLSTLTVGPNTIAMTEVNSTNCSVTTNRTITIDPVPLTDQITGPTSVCPGITGIKYRIISPRQSTYQWVLSSGNGTIVAGQGTTEITVNWNGAANATVSVQAQNTQGCLSPAAVLPVTINPILITPQPAGPVTVCQTLGAPVRYVMNNPTPGSSFNWTVTGGTIVGSAINDTIFVNWNTPGTFTILVNESSSGTVNCFGSSIPLQVTVLASPNPGLQITGPASICENSTGNQFSLGGGTGSTYVWSLTQNSVTTPLSGTGNTISLNTTTPGQYTLSAVETNAAACVGLPITRTITVTPRPVINQIVGANTVCPQNLNNLLFHVNGPAGNTYNWTVQGGALAQLALGNDSVYVNFNQNDPVKSITVTPVSSTGCEGAPFTLPIIMDAASLQLASVTTAEQNDKAIELNFNMPNNALNRKDIEVFRSEFGSGSFVKVGTVTNTQTKFTDNGVQPGEKVYEYRLQSTNECGDQLITTVHNTMVLDAVSQENSKNISLTWNPYLGWGTNEVDRYEIYLKADNGTFNMVDKVAGSETKAILRNITGQGFNLCLRIKAVSKDSRISWSNIDCLGFENKLKFYNVFTPNNDGNNDKFVIENILLYPGNELSVYNRWGSEVFRKKDYDNQWEGKNQSPGTYYYLLKLSDGTSYKGWVEIIK